MNTSLVPVPFHGTTLFLLEQDNEPYTPMKPIVDGMGLDWAGQFTKLKSNPKRWGLRLSQFRSREMHKSEKLFSSLFARQPPG